MDSTHPLYLDIEATRSEKRWARVIALREVARQPKPSSRRHTAKRLRPKSEKLAEAKRRLRSKCRQCGGPPCRRRVHSKEAGFIVDVSYLCECGSTEWTELKAGELFPFLFGPYK